MGAKWLLKRYQPYLNQKSGDISVIQFYTISRLTTDDTKKENLPVHVASHKLKLNMFDHLVMEFWKQVSADKNAL